MPHRARPLLALALLAGCSASPPPAPAPEPAAAAPPAPVAPAAPPPPASVLAAPLPPPPAEASAAPAASASAAASAPLSRCGEGMAYIPGGEYVYGQTNKEKVTLQPFCIDLTEATTDAYMACVKGGKCDGSYVNVCDPSTAGKADRGKMPMVCIDFTQAATYCTAQNKRLPTGEEWEWAARGATATTSHPWGDAEMGDQLCWSGKGKREMPCEVGAYPGGTSPQGVKDLLGNVFEWTTTKNDATSSYRMVRGGSWKDGDKALFNVTRQGAFKTTYRCGFGGVRCVKPAP